MPAVRKLDLRDRDLLAARARGETLERLAASYGVNVSSMSRFFRRPEVKEAMRALAREGERQATLEADADAERHSRFQPAALPAARRLEPARRRWISTAIDPETGERYPNARERHGLSALPPDPPPGPIAYPDSYPLFADAPSTHRFALRIYSNEELLRRPPCPDPPPAAEPSAIPVAFPPEGDKGNGWQAQVRMTRCRLGERGGTSFAGVFERPDLRDELCDLGRAEAGFGVRSARAALASGRVG